MPHPSDLHIQAVVVVPTRTPVPESACSYMALCRSIPTPNAGSFPPIGGKVETIGIARGADVVRSRPKLEPRLCIPYTPVHVFRRTRRSYITVPHSQAWR